MNVLVCFDIDGTLFPQKGHWEAFIEAVEKVYGVKLYKPSDLVPYQGKTDMQIAKEMLIPKGISLKTIEERKSRFFQTMTDEFRKYVKEGAFVPNPGVEKLLEELQRKGVHTGLVTGNIEGVAQAKVLAAGLDEYFDFGGYGSDADERYKLVEIARKRAEELYGPVDSTWLIGDTPTDISAAKRAYARSLAVATGIIPLSELEKSGADAVLRDLSDTQRVLKILGV